MIKPILPFVEMMVTQACNLSCRGCTNYSDVVHKDYLTWEEGKEQIVPWLERVDIPDFGILGGEPLMNPDIRNWIYGLRELMPESQIRFTTNGMLLEQNLDIVDLMHSIGNSVFKITIHKNDSIIEEVIKQITKKYQWKQVREFGIDRLKTTNNFSFQINRPTIFYKSFLGEYNDMLPHNNSPAEAFEICCQKTCPLLYNGKLYKCSTNGLLEDILKKFNSPNFDKWQPYLLNGLHHNCNEDELNKFVDNFGKAHNICRSCPSKKDLTSTISHLNHVTTKKIIPLNS